MTCIEFAGKTGTKISMLPYSKKVVSSPVLVGYGYYEITTSTLSQVSCAR